jgi:hypothetical protein
LFGPCIGCVRCGSAKAVADMRRMPDYHGNTAG